MKSEIDYRYRIFPKGEECPFCGAKVKSWTQNSNVLDGSYLGAYNNIAWECPKCKRGGVEPTCQDCEFLELNYPDVYCMNKESKNYKHIKSHKGRIFACKNFMPDKNRE